MFPHHLDDDDEASHNLLEDYKHSNERYDYANDIEMPPLRSKDNVLSANVAAVASGKHEKCCKTSPDPREHINGPVHNSFWETPKLYLAKATQRTKEIYRMTMATWPFATTIIACMTFVMLINFYIRPEQFLANQSDNVPQGMKLLAAYLVVCLSLLGFNNELYFTKIKLTTMTWSDYRTVVSSKQIPKPKKIGRHSSSTHPISGARRTNVNNYIDNNATLLYNRPSWSIALSTKDIRKGLKGSRINRSPKDEAYFTALKWDHLPPRAIVKCVDDLSHLSRLQYNQLLNRTAQNDGVIQAYTWNPIAPSFVADEWHVRYDATINEWLFRCSDEDSYHHELWDVSTAVISSIDFQFSWTAFSVATLLWVTTIVAHSIAENEHIFSYEHRCIHAICLSITLLLSIRPISHHFMTMMQDVGVVGRTILHVKPAGTWGTLKTIMNYSQLVFPKRIRPAVTVVDHRKDTGMMSMLSTTKGMDKILSMSCMYLGKPVIYLSMNGCWEKLCVDDATVSAALALKAATGKVPSAGWFGITCKTSMKGADASLFLAWIAHKNGPIPRTILYPKRGLSSHGIITYTIDPTSAPSDRKPMTQFATQMSENGAFCAEKNKANSQDAILTRVTLLTNKKPVEHTSRHDMYQKEFIDRYVENARLQGFGPLVPADLSDIKAKQNSTQQTQSIQNAENYYQSGWSGYSAALNEHSCLQTFGKVEIVTGVKNQRNITPVDDITKLGASTVGYALSRYTKLMDSYAFGSSPASVAERVSIIAAGADTILPTDFKRMDGNVKKVLRDFDIALLIAVFGHQYHERVLEFYAATHNRKCRTSEKVNYESEESQLSGDPFTSVLNTLRNMLIAFTALRLSGCTADQAWARLGVYGGDDGLTADLPIKHFITASAMWGMEVTGKPVTRAEKGRVEFMSRVYGPGVWNGSADNCATFPRWIAKFPNSTTANIERFGPSIVAHAKSASALVNDLYTPGVGPMLKKVNRETRKEFLVYCARESKRKQAALLANSNWNAKVADFSSNTGYQASMHDATDTAWMTDYICECAGNDVMSLFEMYLDEQCEWSELPLIIKNKIKPHPTLPTFQNEHLVQPLNAEAEETVETIKTVIKCSKPPVHERREETNKRRQKRNKTATAATTPDNSAADDEVSSSDQCSTGLLPSKSHPTGAKSPSTGVTRRKRAAKVPIPRRKPIKAKRCEKKKVQTGKLVKWVVDDGQSVRPEPNKPATCSRVGCSRNVKPKHRQRSRICSSCHFKPRSDQDSGRAQE